MSQKKDAYRKLDSFFIQALYREFPFLKGCLGEDRGHDTVFHVVRGIAATTIFQLNTGIKTVMLFDQKRCIHTVNMHSAPGGFGKPQAVALADLLYRHQNVAYIMTEQDNYGGYAEFETMVTLYKRTDELIIPLRESAADDAWDLQMVLADRDPKIIGQRLGQALVVLIRLSPAERLLVVHLLRKHFEQLGKLTEYRKFLDQLQEHILAQ